MLKTLLFSLVLTLVLELPIAALWGARKKELLLCVLVNILTNPAVVLLHEIFPPLWFVLLLEGAAIVVEGSYYNRYAALSRPWALAVSANLISWGMGNLLRCWL